MIDFPSLQSKVNDLKAKVEQKSITPTYLGALLDDFLALMKSIDMTGISEDVQNAVRSASTALTTAQDALKKADDAESSSSLATKSALKAVEDAAEAIAKADNANTTANSAKTTAEGAATTASTAQEKADAAHGKAEEALERIGAVEDAVGQPEGIATLDQQGLIPESQLPTSVKNVVEFDGFFSLGALKLEMSSAPARGSIMFVPSSATFVCHYRDGGLAKAYPDWPGADAFGQGSLQGRIPASGKTYIDVSANRQYRWDGTTLVAIGSDLTLGETEQTAYSGDKGKKLREDVDKAAACLDGIRILPFNGIYDQAVGGNRQPPIYGVWWQPSSDGGSFMFRSSDFGYTQADYNDEGLGRTDRIFRCGNNLYRVTDGELRELGGATEGNCLNVTVELPKQGTTNPYYDLESAIARIFEARRTKLGLQITFATTAKSWKQYQYIGASLEADDFLAQANWIDMAGTSAGREPVININDLCGDPTAADFYSFESAVDALAKLEADTKVVYRKPGMVITYRVLM